MNITSITTARKQTYVVGFDFLCEDNPPRIVEIIPDLIRSSQPNRHYFVKFDDGTQIEVHDVVEVWTKPEGG